MILPEELVAIRRHYSNNKIKNSALFAGLDYAPLRILSLLDEIDRLTAENAAHKWESVKDALPENEEDVFILTAYGIRTIADYDGNNNKWYSREYGGHIYNVTHWMPLPDLPTPQKDGNNVNK